MKTLGFYHIEYHQGTKQTKELINRADYEVYRKLSDLKNDLSSKLKGKKKDKKDPKLVAQLREVSAELKKEYPYPFFVVDSPIYDAITTGILSLPENQGGDTVCKVIKIEKASTSQVEDEEDEE